MSEDVLHPVWCAQRHLPIHDHARSYSFDLDDGSGYLIVSLRKSAGHPGPAYVHVSLYNDDDEHGSREVETVDLTDGQAVKVARIMLRSFGDDPFLQELLQSAEAGIAGARQKWRRRVA